MDKFKETLLFISSGEVTTIQKVAILELLNQELDIDTPSEMERNLKARGEKITRNGMLKSRRFKKVKIGKQTFVVNGCAESLLPY